VDGVNLRQLLAGGRVSPREALAIVPQICDALQYAHDSGIVHRDIKPANILIDRRGRVKVADFGLAKIVGNRAELPPGQAASPNGPAGSLTDTAKVLGTPHYMSPEQVAAPGEVDHRADIYALGVVFYQMLTGELPGKRIEPPSTKVRIDVRLDEVVLRALESQPDRRYQQISEVKTLVETIAATPASGDPSQLMSAAGAKREPWMAFCVTLAFAGTVLGGILCQLIPKHVLDGELVGMFLLLALLTPLLAWQLRRRASRTACLAWFKAGAWLAWAGSLPLGAFPVFFLSDLRQQHYQWHPAAGEVVVLALIWIGSLTLPVCGFRLWRAASQSQKHLGLPAMLAIGSILLGIMVAILLTNRPRWLLGQPTASDLGDARSIGATRLTTSYRFGPVIERVIQARETGTNCFLNLATAELLTPPSAIAELLGDNDQLWQAWDIESETRPFQYVTWLRQSGADLMLHNRQEILGFDGFFCLAHGPTAENWDSWDSITPEQTVFVGEFGVWSRRYQVDKKAIAPEYVDGAPHNMSQAKQHSPGKLGAPVVSDLTREQSVTYYFRTRESVSGLLQIAGFTDTPRGVKIRYKLVQKVPQNRGQDPLEISRQLEAGSETNRNKP